MKVNFYDSVPDHLLKFAVIASKSNGKWVLCKHKERTTYEMPGGHREIGEDILDTARRELYEETGAIEYEITPISVYSVLNEDSDNKEETYGLLCYAQINTFGELPPLEMEKIELFDELPTAWTYPLIQPKLIEKIITFLG